MEALQAVAVSGDGGALAEVEMLADFFIGVDAVIEIGNKRGDGAFKVDVVLPKRVVRVKQEMLVLQFRNGFDLRCHRRQRHRLILNTRRKAAPQMVVSAE